MYFVVTLELYTISSCLEEGQYDDSCGDMFACKNYKFTLGGTKSDRSKMNPRSPTYKVGPH
jgi:hypothetical protein